jgi:hypothetical protein
MNHQHDVSFTIRRGKGRDLIVVNGANFHRLFVPTFNGQPSGRLLKSARLSEREREKNLERLEGLKLEFNPEITSVKCG